MQLQLKTTRKQRENENHGERVRERDRDIIIDSRSYSPSGDFLVNQSINTRIHGTSLKKQISQSRQLQVHVDNVANRK